MKQFRVTGIDNRTNKPLQAMIEANDEADAYKTARRQFATIDRIDRIVSAPVAPGAAGRTPGAGAARGHADDAEPDLDELEDEEEEDDRLPDFSTLELDAPRVSGGMKGLLRRYMGQRLAIAVDGQERPRMGRLLSVSEDVFSVRMEGNNLVFHLALRSILAAVETSPGNPTPTTNAQAPGPPGLAIELPRLTIFRFLPDKPVKA